MATKNSEKLIVDKNLFSRLAEEIAKLNEDEQEAVVGYQQFISSFDYMYLGEPDSEEYKNNLKVKELILKYIVEINQEELKHKKWLDNLYSLLTGMKPSKEDL